MSHTKTLPLTYLNNDLNRHFYFMVSVDKKYVFLLLKIFTLPIGNTWEPTQLIITNKKAEEHIGYPLRVITLFVI